MTTLEVMQRAKAVCPVMASVDSDQKNKALLAMADSLVCNSQKILDANKLDVVNAAGISDVMIDRLKLDEARISAMAKGIRDVANLPDPVGNVISETVGANGLKIKRVSVPLGVVAIIYESRPNVTSDAAALAIKSSNVCILRCGKEAHGSAKAIVDALSEGLKSVGLPGELVQLVDDVSRTSAQELMCGKGYIDLLIPRGGAGLIRACVENATVPCIETGTGICHIYVDKSADIEMALNIVENAKTSRPSVCNAAEVCLIHSDIAPDFLPLLEKRLVDERVDNGKPPVELRADAQACKYLKSAVEANEVDFDTEFLDYIMALKIVSSCDEAIEHIARHSTGHSEAIITDDTVAATKFTSLVDSAAVYVNASTRFTDGGEFGLGCEMGISTQKLHARGPMGLKELTAYKYVITGNGNVR